MKLNKNVAKLVAKIAHEHKKYIFLRLLNGELVQGKPSKSMYHLNKMSVRHEFIREII